MGAYYKLVCDQKREQLCPGRIDNGGIKIWSIATRNSAFGSLSIFTMARRWCNQHCRLINDEQGDDEAYQDYDDITQEMIKLYNEEYFPDAWGLQYTPDEE